MSSRTRRVPHCALAHKACLEGYQAQYLRLPRLLTDLRIAHGEGIIPPPPRKLYRDLARIDMLVLDDWGLAPIDAARGRDLLEILDDRFGRRSVVVISQLPVADWHRQLNDPTHSRRCHSRPSRPCCLPDRAPWFVHACL